jgi:DNA-binding LacI/PurR family transcriptional regulator
MFSTELRIDKTDPLPRHAQVQRILRDLVVNGRLKPGDKIPAELQIADALGVSKMTVNKALLALTADGLFVREVGRGTFVAATRDSADASTDLLMPVEKSAGAMPRIALSFPAGARNVLDSDYYGGIYRGVADVIEEAEGGDHAVKFDLSPLAAEDYVAEDQRAPADARLIIAPRAESVESIERLWRAGRPLVVVGASWPTMGVPSVDSDNIGGAAEAVRHLTGLGHERIALLFAEEETANTQDRMVGYRRALAAARLPHEAAWDVAAEQVWKAGDEAKRRLRELVTAPRPVTAIFAAGYLLALEAMNAVRDAGLRVPEDVSVVGFDDPLGAHLVYPALTTVRQPLYEMGRRAADRLLKMVRGTEERSPIREMLPAPLIVRKSTATVPPRRAAESVRHGAAAVA